MPAGAATTSAALRLRAIFTRNAMPATATIRPSIAPKNNAFFQATGFCCGGGVRPLGGLKGGGPTGGVGGTACGPVDGKALVGKIGGGENWLEEMGVGGGVGGTKACIGGGVAKGGGVGGATT